jgi:polyisoprenyl-phosphate glycosyltransferase
MMRIDVVCPVFREEASIATFHNALLAATGALSADFAFRYIYVVDPSSDRSEIILRDLAEHDRRVAVIVMSRRFGHQAALVAGLDASTGDAVVMLDSDMQHPPSLVPVLIEHWQTGADVVQALREDGDTIAFGKRLTSSLFYRLFERFTKIQINSGAADFRLLSRRVVDVFRTQLREHNPFFRGLVTWIGYKIVYVPFTPARRVAGRSNYSLSSLTAFALNGLCSFSKLPLRVCIALGLFFAALSMVLGVILVIVYFLLGSTYAPGWASLFALLSFASSINLFFLGVLGEYVGLIFDEVKDRPRYLVGRTYGAKPAEEAALSAPSRGQGTAALVDRGVAVR